MKGFTLVELIMMIVILAILSITAVIKWPSGLKEEAAAREFKRAVRYAQHKAMTREFTTNAAAWGIVTSGNQYTIKRADDSETAEASQVNRSLPGNAGITSAALYFNGLGEPLTAAGLPLAGALTFTIIADDSGTTLSVCPRTGYIQAGGSCP